MSNDRTASNPSVPQAGGVPLPDATVHLHPGDNVAIAKAEIPSGTTLLRADGESPLAARQTVPGGHKLALEAIAPGDPVRRYGQVIGFASRPIAPGEHVHVHNVEIHDFERRFAPQAGIRPVTPLPVAQRRTFLGYLRPDGRVGTRNQIAVISTVNCSATVTRRIAHHFTPERLAAYPNVDAVIPYTHQTGCTFRQGSRDHALLQRTLAGIARHPNVAAYLLVSLGCETTQIDGLVSCCDLDLREGAGLVIQEMGGSEPTVAAGIAAIERLLPEVDAARRSEQPLSGLTLALQCGGSDGWSGVTANPLVGLLADEVVRQGGAVVLSETPEIFGAEHLLARRAVDEGVAAKLMDHVRWWEDQARAMGMELDHNRGVGNEAGGLTTIYEKSLGAIAKGGSTPLVDVYDYAEPVEARGLIFMNAPGNDPVAVTGQVAGGCNLVLFTTGRGSVFGFHPAPSIKISTSSGLFRRMTGDMDFNAGRVLEGESMVQLAAELLDLVVDVASGRRSKSELLGAGEAEFAPWYLGGML